MGKNDKIVVFQSFDTSVQGNLVKTKLDAYGIPCFLTDENFVNLYPIRNEIFPGIRLHIFESDTERVSEILNENIAPEIDQVIKYPICKSDKVELDYTRKSILGWLVMVIFQIITPQKRVFKCQTCDSEFDYI